MCMHACTPRKTDVDAESSSNPLPYVTPHVSTCLRPSRHRAQFAYCVTGCLKFCTVSRAAASRKTTKKLTNKSENYDTNLTKVIKNRCLGWSWKLLGEVLEALWLPRCPRTAKVRQILVRWPPLGPPRETICGSFLDQKSENVRKKVILKQT